MLNFTFFVFVTLAFKFAKEGDINQGVLATGACLSAFYNVIIFYILFKETVEWYQLLGMLLLLTSVITLSFEAASKSQEKLDVSEEIAPSYGKKTSAFLSILCAIAASVCVTLRQIVIRKFKDLNYPPITQVIDAGILEISMFSVVSIFLYSKH